MLVENFFAGFVDDRPADHDAAHARLMADHDPVFDRAVDCGRSGPPSTISPMRIGTLLVDESTTCRSSWARRAFLLPQIAGGQFGVGHGAGPIHRIFAEADQAQAADRFDRFALHQIIAPDVGIAGADGVLQLIERNAVSQQSAGIGHDLIALGGAAIAADVGDPRHAAKGARAGSSLAAISDR